MRFFILHCLGHLSALYRRIIQERFSLRDECGFMATRLMAMSVSFEKLASLDSNGDKCITQDVMWDRLSKMLKGRGHILDDEEVRHLVNYCFKVNLEPDVYRLSSIQPYLFTFVSGIWIAFGKLKQGSFFLAV